MFRSGSVSRVVAIFMVSLAASCLLVGETRAQNVFSDIFGWIIKPNPSPLENLRQRDYSYGGYRTVCVRLCDGYYFPIKNSSSRGSFHRDAQQCQAQCSTDSRLFYMPAQALDMKRAVDLSGLAYTSLKNAFVYRKKLVKGCSCRPPPWSADERARHKMYETAPGSILASPGPGTTLTGTQEELMRRRFSSGGYGVGRGVGGGYGGYPLDIEQGPVARPKAWVRQYPAASNGGLFGGGPGAVSSGASAKKKSGGRPRQGGAGGAGPSYLWPEGGG